MNGASAPRFVGRSLHAQKIWHLPFDSWRWVDSKNDFFFIKIGRWSFSKINDFFSQTGYFFIDCLVSLCFNQVYFVKAYWIFTKERTISITKPNAKYHICPPQLTLRWIMQNNFHYGTKSCTLGPETARNGSLIGGFCPALRATEETCCSLSP